MDARGARAVLRRFGQFADQFADCFSRRVQRDAASQYLEGLFNDSERKSMQAMHGRLSDPVSYQALQHSVTHSPWEIKPVWRRLRDVVPERRGILAVDDTGLPKQGKHSVGVKRQYCGTLGKTGNCQVAVSSLLIGKHLVWPLSCELYLPREWVDEAARGPSALARNDPLLLTKSDPLSKQDLGAQPTEDPAFAEGGRGAPNCRVRQMGTILPHNRFLSCGRWAGQGSPKVTSGASLPLTGPLVAAIGGPLFVSNPGSFLDSVEGARVSARQGCIVALAVGRDL